MISDEFIAEDVREETVVETVTIPIVAEYATVNKDQFDRESLKIHVGSETSEESLVQNLMREALVVERVPIDRVVDVAPTVRQLDDRVIVPVLEERLVVEKRLVLVEELHVLRRREEHAVEVPVTLRRTAVTFERDQLATGRPTDPDA